MPIVRFVKRHSNFKVPMGANLMKSLLEHEVPVASSCQGDGICSKCHIKIIEGEKNLNPKSQLEIDLLKKNNLPSENRLSCQVKILGDVTVDTTYW